MALPVPAVAGKQDLVSVKIGVLTVTLAGLLVTCAGTSVQTIFAVLVMITPPRVPAFTVAWKLTVTPLAPAFSAGIVQVSVRNGAL